MLPGYTGTWRRHFRPRRIGMRNLVMLLALLGAALAVSVSSGTAATHARTCGKKDDAGNWEVVLGHAKSAKGARAIVSRASKKSLRATVEEQGCSKTWDAIVTVKTKAEADATRTMAVKDGFKTARIERS
jgi:hypothetical protein